MVHIISIYPLYLLFIIKPLFRSQFALYSDLNLVKIYDQFLSARDWPFGSSLSLILVTIMLSLLFIQSLILAKKKL